MQPAQVAPGAKGTLKVTITILEGWHANAKAVMDSKLVPTTFATRPAANITWGTPKFPGKDRHGAGLSHRGEDIPGWRGDSGSVYGVQDGQAR